MTGERVYDGFYTLKFFCPIKKVNIYNLMGEPLETVSGQYGGSPDPVLMYNGKISSIGMPIQDDLFGFSGCAWEFLNCLTL